MIDTARLQALLLSDCPSDDLMSGRIIDCHMREGKIALIIESDAFPVHEGPWCSAPLSK